MRLISPVNSELVPDGTLQGVREPNWKNRLRLFFSQTYSSRNSELSGICAQ